MTYILRKKGIEKEEKRPYSADRVYDEPIQDEVVEMFAEAGSLRYPQGARKPGLDTLEANLRPEEDELFDD